MRLARWESRSGKYWVEISRDDLGSLLVEYDGGFNSFGPGFTEAEVFASVERRIAEHGYFDPDDAKTPMKRVV